MVARTRSEPDALVVVFERDGEEPVRVEVINGDKALLRAVAVLMAKSKLHVGDCLRVEAAD
jgi:hypothetical protein